MSIIHLTAPNVGRPRIIGLMGRARSGKSTSAAYIASMFPEYKRVAFATALKDCVGAMFKGRGETITEEDKPKEIPIGSLNGMTYARALQIVGQTMRKELDAHIWINILLQRYEDSSIIIEDVRFPNENNYVTFANGIIIRIVRPNAPELNDGRKSSDEDVIDTMPSKYTVVNDGTIEELHAKLFDLMTKICSGN